MTTWTLDVDAKIHEVHGKQKQGAAKAYNGVYALQPLYAFVHETDELVQVELRAGQTHPGAKAVAFLRRVARLKPTTVTTIRLRRDSALYNHEVVDFCEEQGWPFTITADQTAPLLARVSALAPEAWQPDPEDASLAYAEVADQPVGWKQAYRYLVRREQQPEPAGQAALFERYSYYIVVTNQAGAIKTLVEDHDRRGTTEKRIGEFTRECLAHLPMGHFMANGVYLRCAQLAYNVALWIRDLALPPSYRKKAIKRLRRCIGLIAAKVTTSGRQIRLKLSTLHRWWRDFAQAWTTLPTLSPTCDSG